MRGNVATIAALCAIPVIAAVTGVMELQSIASAKGKLQAAVDAGALAAAQRISVATVNGTQDITNTAITASNANLNGVDPSTVTYSTQIDTSKNSVTLAATTYHKAIVGFLNFGNATISVSATADALGSAPLCILQTGAGKNDQLNLQDHATIRATGCAIHANADISVAPSALIQAERVQAVGTISGRVSPAGYPGALPIADPFASMNIKPPLSCIGKATTLKVLKYTVLPLLPGVHCEHYYVDVGATLILMPGEHYFMNDLDAQNSSSIVGDDVTLIFGSTESIKFADHATVKLSARKSGPFAGFLIATTRNNTETFSISSDHVSQLLGTIYIPNAELAIDTVGNVAQDSDWSIIVAKSLVLNHTPNLVINVNYAGSGVPVPTGVGPDQKVSLVQ